MIEKLKQVRELFQILAEEEKIIKERGVNHENYQKDMEALDTLRQELNNMALEIIKSEPLEEKSRVDELKEMIDKNKERLTALENQSKKLYPEIEGIDETRKKDILESNGFISTKRVDGIETYIDRTLVASYYDLVKETRRLEEEYNSLVKQESTSYETQTSISVLDEEEPEVISLPSTFEEQTEKLENERERLESELKSVREQILTLLNDRSLPNQGKKTSVMFEGTTYYGFPRKKKGLFNTLNTQYNSLRKKLRELPVQEETSMENSAIEETPIALPPHTEHIETGEPIGLPPHIETTQKENSGEFGAEVEVHSDNPTSSPEPKDPVQEIVDEVFNVINKEDQPAKEKETTPTETPSSTHTTSDGENVILLPPSSLDPNSPTSPEKPSDGVEEELKDLEDEEVEEVNKPKFLTRIKDWVKKHKLRLAAAVAAITIGITSLFGFFNKNNKQQVTSDPITPTVSDEGLGGDLSETTGEVDYELPQEEQEELIPENEVQTETPEEYTDVESEEQEMTDEYTETYSDGYTEDTIQIGDSVGINEGARIYATAQDAMLGENSYNPYYDSNTDRIALGVSIAHGGEIIHILANTPDYNQKIINLLNDGGEIVSVLTAAQDRFNGTLDGKTPITSAEINSSVEGFYNGEEIYNINVNNSVGRGR